MWYSNHRIHAQESYKSDLEINIFTDWKDFKRAINKIGTFLASLGIIPLFKQGWKTAFMFTCKNKHTYLVFGKRQSKP